jgi:hypothetical protein
MKRKIARPDLTFAKMFHNNIKKKIFFGAPNPLFIFEDIALSYSLDELKHMFYETLEYVEKYGELENWAVITEPVDFTYNFTTVSKFYNHRLYKKKMMYTASVMRKLMKIYKKVGMICHNSHVQKVREYVEDPNLPEFDKIFHQDEYHEKISTVLAR